MTKILFSDLTLADIEAHGDALVAADDWQTAGGMSRADALEAVDLIRGIMLDTGAPTLAQAVDKIARFQRERAHGAN